MARGNGGLGLLGSFLVVWLGGCAFLTSPTRDYVSNRTLMEQAASDAGYEVDPGRFQLVMAQVEEDSITFQYQGLEHPGDTAWVLRFSAKSTEQDPVALADVYDLLPVLAEGRAGFNITEEGEKEWDGATVRFVRYRFESKVRDDQAKPLAGHGIVAALTRGKPGQLLVYKVKLDNHGDRDDVLWEDLLAFLEPLRTL
jgi:hypothetical protein